MPRWILGVSALYHDSAAALLCDGVVVAAAQEERFTRLKHDKSLPVRAVRWCLDQAGIGMGDVEYLVFYEKPLRKFERILVTTVATFPRSWKRFSRAMHSWLGDRLWQRNKLSATFGFPPSRILFSEHHLSHAASAFLTSPFEEAAIIAVDGVGEWATTSLWRGTRAPPFIEPIAEIRYPHSIGLFYSAITAYLGFEVNEGEYKVMGMAPFGQPRYRAAMDKLLRLDDKGGFDLDMSFFSYHWHASASSTSRLDELLGGPPRFPGSPFIPPESIGAPPGAPGDHPPEVVEESRRYADIAASAQQAVEDAVLHLARHAHAQTGADALCLAGGVALNSVANRRLGAEGPFKHLWVQPAAGDAGGSLGAALWAWHCVLGQPRNGWTQRPDLGAAWTRDAVRDVLDDLGFPYEDVGAAAPARAAEELANGGVIAWFNGRFEWGPRALGFRSILADPRREEMKDVVNSRIKFREQFRPFAPAVLEERAAEWFDIPAPAWDLARFMLTTAGVHPEKRQQIPATTHVDGSARVQVVREPDNPQFYALIREFGERTGVPVVMNTSFNLKGDPIASGPIDAVATLMRCELDALYIEGFRLPRPPQKARRE